MGKILLRCHDVATVAGVKPSTWSNFSRKWNKVFLPGHFEFDLLVFG